MLNKKKYELSVCSKSHLEWAVARLAKDFRLAADDNLVHREPLALADEFIVGILSRFTRPICLRISYTLPLTPHLARGRGQGPDAHTWPSTPTFPRKTSWSEWGFKPSAGHTKGNHG